jgi:hypothetical protein
MVRALSLGFGTLSGIALYFLIIPGIIIVLIGLLVRKFRPLNRARVLGFEMGEWLSLVVYGMVWLASGAVLVFLEVVLA